MNNLELVKKLSVVMGVVESLHSLCNQPEHLCLIEQLHSYLDEAIVDISTKYDPTNITFKPIVNCKHNRKKLTGLEEYFCSNCGEREE